MTEYELFNALRPLFPPAEYALLPQVGNSTGFGTIRHADALALGLWPSRGLRLHGFEIKSNRSDWVRELANPAKAEEIAQYCHHWWVVAAHAGIVQDGELPHGWGLMVFDPEKRVLYRVQQAPFQTASLEVTLSFVAAILRKAQDCIGPAAVLLEKYDEGYQKGLDDGKRTTACEAQEYRKLKTKMSEFEKSSGVKIDDWRPAESIGAAVRTVLDGKVAKYTDDLKAVAKRILEELP